MPKKIRIETAEEQAARFERDVERMINDGEFDPVAAAKALDKLVGQTGNERLDDNHENHTLASPALAQPKVARKKALKKP